MDEDLLLSELVDSDDDVELDLDVIIGDFHCRGSTDLLAAVRSKIGINGYLPMSESFNDNENYMSEICDRIKYEVSESFDMDENVESEILDGHGNGELFLDISTLYAPNEFLQLFRVKLSEAELLIKQFKSVGPEISHVPSEVQVLSVLWYLGQEAATHEDIYTSFGLESDQFDEIFHKVIEFFSTIESKEIYLSNKKDKEMTKKHFLKEHGLKGVIGCVDTVRIKMKSVEDEGNDNFGGRYHVVLQAVVNEKGKFNDLHVCETATTNTEVFLNSPLYEDMPTICADGEYFLGGGSFPCLRYLVCPFADTGNLTGDQIYFNLKLATCLQITDTAFSLLSQRFKKLGNLHLPSSTSAIQTVTACCRLHNIASIVDFENMNETPVSNNFVDDVMDFNERISLNTPTFRQGLELRDKVCQKFLKK